MLILIISVSIVILTVFVFHKKVKHPILLELVPMSWSPINIIYLDSRQQQLTITDKTGGAVHSNHKKTPTFSEVFSDVSSFSDSETYVISKEPDYFSFATPCWKEDDCENTAVRCTRELISPDCVLDACNSDVFMTQSPEGTILPM